MVKDSFEAYIVSEELHSARSLGDLMLVNDDRKDVMDPSDRKRYPANSEDSSAFISECSI